MECMLRVSGTVNDHVLHQLICWVFAVVSQLRLLGNT